MGVVFALTSVISGSLVYFSGIYCWCKLLNVPMKQNVKNILIALFLMTAVGGAINLFVPHYLKIIAIIMMLVGVNYAFFSKSLEKSVVSVILFEIVSMMAELVFTLIVSLSLGEMSNLNEIIGVITINIWVSLIDGIIVQMSLIKRIYIWGVKYGINLRSNKIISIVILTIILASILMATSWMDLPRVLVASINTSLIVIYLVIVFALVYTHEKYQKIYERYEISLKSLREYEKVMNKYRVNNHESQNQLRAIRNMITNKDTKTINYIDKIIENKTKDSDMALNRTSKIPEGSIKATIYSEICKMEELKINYNLNISNDVQTADLINLNDDTIYNICQILGVLLDNAIEEVKCHKRKKITIEMFMLDGELCVEISNKYKGELNLRKISEKGYTTKGKGHGYGLALVKKLVSEDKKITNEQIISKDIFTQRITIDL